MAQFRKKPVVIEAITFAEFVEFAQNTTKEPHFSVVYQGHNVTHENDTLYLIPTDEGIMNFTPQDMLITGVKGEIYPCKLDIFNATYDKVETAVVSGPSMEKTLGESRVRTDFNVGGSSLVDEIKIKSAHLINLAQSLRGDSAAVANGEKVRLIEKAKDDYESAAMWAVKAATF